MNLFSRRRFVLSSAGLALSPVSMATSTAPYRALVCVFLEGGNDGNNTVVPTDRDGYSNYVKARGAASAGGLALAQASLVPLTGSTLALHPSLAPLQELWRQGRLAIQANVGTLAKPLTKAQYLSNEASRPPGLFSHSDQVSQWQRGATGMQPSSGWGGRVADALGASAMPSVISMTGNAVFINGEQRGGLALTTGSPSQVMGFGSAPASNPLYNLYADLLRAQTQSSNPQIMSAASVQLQALQVSTALTAALSTKTVVNDIFASQSGPLAQQLLSVAKMIEARQSFGARRQVFFVSLGGFDTHSDQLTRQSALLTQLSGALMAFYGATQALGIANQVTAFTASEFGRTLQPATGGGSDHGWGNHQLMIGDAVKGGLYGVMPSLVRGGPDDIGSEGRFVPTTSSDQMGATLAAWLGITGSDLTRVFPNLGSFSRPDLGYFV